MLEVRSGAARAVAWVGVEDTLKGGVAVRSVAWVAHVGGKNGSNVGEAEVAGLCVDTIEPLKMSELRG